MYRLVLIMLVLISFISCKKEPGEGGTSNITGRVYAKYYNKSLQFLGESYAPDERVFIVYGNDSAIGNDTRSDFDGGYTFKYLHKGNYTVYAYSDCDSCPSGVQQVKVEVPITKNRQTETAPTINIIRKR